MKVVWMEHAENALNHTANNITVMFGKKASDKLLEKVYHVGCLLENNPFMGAMEPLLAHRTISYRSIVINRLSKLVYRIVEDRIEIADF